MVRYLKDGLINVWRHPFLLLVLFLYQFAWGLALYELVQSIVLPLLRRYPDKTVSNDQIQLFFAEAQFHIVKTDMIYPYLWLLLWLFAARMLLSPILNAGIYFSITHTHLNSGYRFFKGIQKLSKSFFAYYIIQMTLTLAPLYLVWPEVKQLAAKYPSYETMLLHLLPIMAVYLIYGYVLHLSFMYVQFGKTGLISLPQSIVVTVRNAPSILCLAGIILLISLILSMIVVSASLFWAGFWALLLYQVYGFLQTFIGLWAVVAQHRLFLAKTDSLIK